MKKYIIPVMMCVFVVDGFAAVKVKNATAERYEAQIIEETGMEADEASDIATLENDIRILDEEIEKCKKQKKGWITATVVGAAGVVATGTAAAVQGVQIKEKKYAYAEKKSEYDSKKKKLETLQGQNKETK